MKTNHGKPLFIVFEGLDGTGKTSVAKLLAQNLGATFMTTPSETVRDCRETIIDSFSGCQEAAQMFYLSTVLAASCEVKKLLDAGTSVVLDRYFLSTQVYAEFRGSRLDIEHEIARLLIAPDLTVFVDAPLEVRQSRIVGRGASSAADNETLSEKSDGKLRQLYWQRANSVVAGRLIAVDSSKDSVQDLACRISEDMCRIYAI